MCLTVGRLLEGPSTRSFSLVKIQPSEVVDLVGTAERDRNNVEGPFPAGWKIVKLSVGFEVASGSACLMKYLSARK